MKHLAAGSTAKFKIKEKTAVMVMKREEMVTMLMLMMKLRYKDVGTEHNVMADVLGYILKELRELRGQSK